MEVGLRNVENYKLSGPRPLAGKYLGENIVFWKVDLFSKDIGIEVYNQLRPLE